MIRVFLVHEIKPMCNIVSAALEDEEDIQVVLFFDRQPQGLGIRIFGSLIEIIVCLIDQFD